MAEELADKTNGEGQQQLPVEEAEVMTCDEAKQEILKLMDHRKELESKLLDGFDKHVFREKKRLDRTIRRLFEDFAVCNVGEETPEKPEEPLSPPATGP